MLCIQPYFSSEHKMEFGCGKCVNCIVNKRRTWTGRFLLEQQFHEYSSFVTLTYEKAPRDLIPEDLCNFFKRFRKYYPTKVSYFGVGEYGDVNWRPHFHIAMFGLDPNHREYVEKAWSLGGKLIGMTQVVELNQATSQYIVGYLDKKLTKADDPRLEGRHPEFARMSRNPAIGSRAAASFSQALHSGWKQSEGECADDMPLTMRVGGRHWPLGRYIRSKVREEAWGQKEAPKSVIKKVQMETMFMPKSEVALRRRKALNQAQTITTRSSFKKRTL